MWKSQIPKPSKSRKMHARNININIYESAVIGTV